MAFDNLQEKITKSLRSLQGKSKLSDKNMEDTLKEIRIALLEADVNYNVTKQFLNDIREKAIGQDVLNDIEPGDALIKIVHDELVSLLGEEEPLHFKESGMSIFMMVGLQGTGKTTQAAKIAKFLKNKQNRKPLLIAADVIRPAAIEQLEILGKEVGVDVFSLGCEETAVNAVIEGLKKAHDGKYDTVIIDTAGRLQIDEQLMNELIAIKDIAHPDEILLTVDALTGQDIVNVAKTFHETLGVTGLVVTKYDGDSKGGGVLSVKAVTGAPIKFTGVGEKMDDLEVFHPDRLAERILGMGDVISLVEKAQEKVDMQQAERDAKKMLSGHFDMDDLLRQIEQSRKLGPLSAIMKMMPGGMSEMASAINDEQADQQIKKTRAMIQSMTKEEREDPSLIRSSRKKRIADGSGTTVTDVNRLLSQFEKMQKMMKQLSSMKGLFNL